MQKTIQKLRGLQQLDTKIYSVKDELRRLPAERERRRKAINGRTATRDDLDNQITQLKLQIREIEMDATQRRQKIRKYESELNDTTDGVIVASLQHQIRTLKRDVSQGEDETLEFMTTLEDLTNKREALDAEVQEEERHFAEFETNMQAEMKAAEAKLKELTAERIANLSGDMDQSVVRVYESLLDSREGVALSQLDGRTCTMCYMEVPANLSVRIAMAADLVRCPSCDRILYTAN